MLRIKLVRAGRAQSETYRLIIQPDREKLQGPVVETIGLVLGHKRDQIKIDKKRLDYWIKNGAIPTASVAKLL